MTKPRPRKVKSLSRHGDIVENCVIVIDHSHSKTTDEMHNGIYMLYLNDVVISWRPVNVLASVMVTLADLRDQYHITCK